MTGQKSTKIVKDKPPAAGKGRPKGALNKTTALAKDAIAFAANALGGPERLVSWAQEDPKNESVFWTTIYPKLIPLDVNHAGTVDMALKTQRDAAVKAAQRADG